MEHARNSTWRISSDNYVTFPRMEHVRFKSNKNSITLIPISYFSTLGTGRNEIPDNSTFSISRKFQCLHWLTWRRPSLPGVYRPNLQVEFITALNEREFSCWKTRPHSTMPRQEEADSSRTAKDIGHREEVSTPRITG